jgi:hypothetical protein
MKSGSDRYRIWCWVGFRHGGQKAGRSRFCMILGGSCLSRNVGEGGKSSQKLFAGWTLVSARRCLRGRFSEVGVTLISLSYLQAV